MENDQRLDAVFYALSDRRRRLLLAELAAGPKSVSELAATAQMKISAASKHIAILEAAQLIYKTRQQRQLYCHLHFDVWREVANYVGMHAQFWSGRLDELASFIKTTGAK
jgi:DNA-binding transcriptional ArsR family regulator